MSSAYYARGDAGGGGGPIPKTHVLNIQLCRLEGYLHLACVLRDKTVNVQTLELEVVHSLLGVDDANMRAQQQLAEACRVNTWLLAHGASTGSLVLSSSSESPWETTQRLLPLFDVLQPLIARLKHVEFRRCHMAVVAPRIASLWRIDLEASAETAATTRDAETETDEKEVVLSQQTILPSLTLTQCRMHGDMTPIWAFLGRDASNNNTTSGNSNGNTNSINDTDNSMLESIQFDECDWDAVNRNALLGAFMNMNLNESSCRVARVKRLSCTFQRTTGSTAVVLVNRLPPHSSHLSLTWDPTATPSDGSVVGLQEIKDLVQEVEELLRVLTARTALTTSLTVNCRQGEWTQFASLALPNITKIRRLTISIHLKDKKGQITALLGAMKQNGSLHVARIQSNGASYRGLGSGRCRANQNHHSGHREDRRRVSYGKSLLSAVCQRNKRLPQLLRVIAVPKKKKHGSVVVVDTLDLDISPSSLQPLLTRMVPTLFLAATQAPRMAPTTVLAGLAGRDEIGISATTSTIAVAELVTVVGTAFPAAVLETRDQRPDVGFAAFAPAAAEVPTTSCPTVASTGIAVAVAVADCKLQTAATTTTTSARIAIPVLPLPADTVVGTERAEPRAELRHRLRRRRMAVHQL